MDPRVISAAMTTEATQTSTARTTSRGLVTVTPGSVSAMIARANAIEVGRWRTLIFESSSNKKPNRSRGLMG